jgi:hypothetical protein
MKYSTTDLFDLLFAGTSDQKISRMEELHARHGDDLKKNASVISSLALIDKHSDKLAAHMLVMKLDHLCTTCASIKGGGCCSSYMEANSSTLLLLINKLHGVNVCRQHTPSADCCFLGKKGCILPIKPIFCLNYNCKHIVDQATREEMSELELLAGELLMEQNNLESIIMANL